MKTTLRKAKTVHRAAGFYEEIGSSFFKKKYMTYFLNHKPL